MDRSEALSLLTCKGIRFITLHCNDNWRSEYCLPTIRFFGPWPESTFQRFPLFPRNALLGIEAMLNPSKSDCITILSAASELTDDAMLSLDASQLGLTRNGMETAAAFLVERACFKCYQESDGHYAVGGLSLQGRLRLEQLSNG
ncbi:hypothetical protein B0G77_0083 [Paraburkholderia sp. BL10I2N1]|nr:hypothetical protein B0G77_0083 [Paraburkholderia sp. BL10I2N1]